MTQLHIKKEIAEASLHIAVHRNIRSFVRHRRTSEYPKLVRTANRSIESAMFGLNRCFPIHRYIVQPYHSGHLCVQYHVLGIKVFPSCPTRNIIHTAPEHILTYIGFQKIQLFSSSDEVLTKLKHNGFMDMI